MNLAELKKEIQKYQYMTYTGIIDVSLASIVATRMNLGDPVWLVLIGKSSGGKSQILRPLSLTDNKFIHRIDDVTENTFLSGMQSKGENNSLLLRIGKRGLIILSDLTVLFSKSSEARATILSQFRMIYDGEMTKFSGNSSKPIRWPEEGKGHLGVIAGSTPSIYAHFEEVADMGERFIYYRMKEVDPRVATELALNRTIFGQELDETLASIYGEYIQKVVEYSIENELVPTITEKVQQRIIDISVFAEKARTPVHMDFKGERIMKIPTPAMPMRVALQLSTIAKSLSLIAHFETGSFELNEEQLTVLDWCAYSLANEEKRACMRILASVDYGTSLYTSVIADHIGLSTSVVGMYLQNLSAVGMVKRTGTGDQLAWRINDEEDWNIIRRIEGIGENVEIEHRDITFEEMDSEF